MRNGLSTMSIIILMISLMCTVVGLLGVVTARSDFSKASRQAEYVQAVQECRNQAQNWIAEEAPKAEPGVEQTKEFTDNDGHTLSAAFIVKDGKCTITKWQLKTEWTDKIHLDVK
ncbi:MAG: hypothetical protein HUJ75_07910 [Parasporobacterium sp.]|nr:hypothetical protein [Parasporobacterium sp.]